MIYQAPKENIVNAEYDSELNSIIVKWYTMIAIEDLEPCYRAMAKAAQTYKPSSMIMDTSEAKNTIRNDDLDWIDTYFFPRLIHYGAHDIIIIPPTSAITKEAMKDFIDAADKRGIILHTVENIQEAKLKAVEIKSRTV